MDPAGVQAFFERYASVFNRALAGTAGMDEVAALYAPAFIAASPAGVMSGSNDEQLQRVMAEGYERYRALGTKAMQLRGVQLQALDDLHGVARVAWRATYARKDQADAVIDFELHYFVRQVDGEPIQVFGWVAGDEEALLREHGIGV